MKFRHPSRRALEAWLLGENDAALDAHLASCERCSLRLEETEPADAPDLRASLALAFSTPARLEERLEQHLHGRLSKKSELDIIAGLFAVGFDTTKLLLEIPERPSADRPQHDNDTGRGTR